MITSRCGYHAPFLCIGKRQRKDVDYSEALTEKQWVRALEDGKLEEAEETRKKRKRRKKEVEPIDETPPTKKKKKGGASRGIGVFI